MHLAQSVLLAGVCWLAEACHAASTHGPVGQSALPPPSGAPLRIDEELSVRSLGPDTFVVTHDALWEANILVARMPDGSVLIASSPADTVTTRALLAWIERALAPARILAVNTHFHLDGTGGNEAYRAAGVATYASEHTQALLAAEGTKMRRSAATALADRPALAARVANTAVVPAEHTFSERDGLSLRLGSEEVRVFYPGAAHSPDNLAVYFPARSVLFGGCMVRSGDAIGNLASADLASWPGAIEALRVLSPEVVVAGHGFAAGDALARTLTVVAQATRDSPPTQPSH
jgi:metallo-beta-lactamase class B